MVDVRIGILGFAGLGFGLWGLGFRMADGANLSTVGVDALPHPKPQTLSPKPLTQNPKPLNPNPKP